MKTLKKSFILYTASFMLLVGSAGILASGGLIKLKYEQQSDNVHWGQIEKKEDIFREKILGLIFKFHKATDMIGNNPGDAAALAEAKKIYGEFFTPNGSFFFNGEIIPPGTGQAGELFGKFVNEFFSTYGFIATRYGYDDTPVPTIKNLGNGEFRVITYGVTDHYQLVGEKIGDVIFLSIWDDIVVRTDKNGQPKIDGHHFRVRHREAKIQGVMKINGARFP